MAEAANGSVTATYLRGLNLISRTAGTATSYYSFNAHGDVVKLTNAGGTVTKSYDYDAETGTYYLRARYYAPALGRFTQQDTHWNTANMIYGDNPQKINEREDALGLKHYSYVPQITAVMQSGNLYVYGVNDPVAYVDPTGEAVANIIGAVIGAGGGALLGTMVADHYELTGWKRTVTIGGFTIGGAVLGWFAGGVVEKLAMKIATKMGLVTTAGSGGALAANQVSKMLSNVINAVLTKGVGVANDVGNIIYSYVYKGQTIEVTTRVVDGAVRIVDAWVKTR